MPTKYKSQTTVNYGMNPTQGVHKVIDELFADFSSVDKRNWKRWGRKMRVDFLEDEVTQESDRFGIDRLTESTLRRIFLKRATHEFAK